MTEIEEKCKMAVSSDHDEGECEEDIDEEQERKRIAHNTEMYGCEHDCKECCSQNWFEAVCVSCQCVKKFNNIHWRKHDENECAREKSVRGY